MVDFVRDAEVMNTHVHGSQAGPLMVGATSSLVGVSVRTLHHWDAIGLVRPSGRSGAGYRLYSRDDVALIHRILVYRDLGFPLAEVAEMVQNPHVDERAHLVRQRELLAERIDHLQQMVCAVNRMMEAEDMNQKLSPQQQAEIFGQNWNPEYQLEAERRWGDSPQWEQSQRVVSKYTREDWQRVKETGDQLNERLAQAKREGTRPGSDRANVLAEEHRAMIGEFYDCTHSMHVCLSAMYVEDPRFTEFYETLEPGLASWLREIIVENARRHGVDPDTATWE